MKKVRSYMVVVGMVVGLLFGNCGKKEEEVSPPSAPTGAKAEAGDGQVTLSWNAVKEADSYNIYWANTAGVTKENGAKIAGVSSPYVHRGLKNGTTYYYVVTAVNENGESKESEEVSATPKSSDTTPPNTTITSFPRAITNSTTATFEFTCDKASCRFECKLDSVGYSPCSSPKIYTGLSEGSHTFNVRAIDSAGNVDQTPASYSWVVDTIPPAAMITSSPPDPNGSADVTFAFTCNEGSCRFECELDGGGYSSCSSPKIYTGLSEGSHTFKVRAIDSVGNVGNPDTYSWEIIFICSANGDAVRIVNPLPFDGSSITSGNNTFSFVVEYKLQLEESADLYVYVTDEDWNNIIPPQTVSLSQGCGVESFDINLDIPSGTRLVYVEVSLIVSSFIMDLLNYIVDNTPDWISIVSTDPPDGSIITTPNVTLSATVEYSTSQDNAVQYIVFDEHGNFLDYRYRFVFSGSGTINFSSDISIGCMEMIYILVDILGARDIV